MPLAHPQQRCSLHAAQLLLPMQLNGIDDPGHSDLRQHAIPPAHTGQIVCSQTRTYLVSATVLCPGLDLVAGLLYAPRSAPSGLYEAVQRLAGLGDAALRHVAHLVWNLESRLPRPGALSTSSHGS